MCIACICVAGVSRDNEVHNTADVNRKGRQWSSAAIWKLNLTCVVQDIVSMYIYIHLCIMDMFVCISLHG